MTQSRESARTTYYAKVDESHGPDNPRGLVRRQHTEPPVDEYFGRDGVWHPTEYLVRYALGHNDTDHVEITEEQARTVAEGWLARWAATETSTPGER